MEKRKRIIMVVLSVVVCIMAIGYALLAQQLNINGTASIDTKWRIQITNITEKDIVGEAYSKVTPSYTAITANFNVGLIKPGDSITYDVEVSNLGTLKAKVDSINISTSNSDGIIYTVSGIEEGDKLDPSEKDILTIKVEYDKNATSIPEVTTKNITIIMNYVQDMGDETEVNPSPSPEYQAYSVGDQITFAGSKWYVIKDSTASEDYVTLMKSQVLFSFELGEYASTPTCTQDDVTYGWYDCTTVGEIAGNSAAMAYYWSDTCHKNGFHGYKDDDVSGCSGHNDYERSKVREMLEDHYLPTLGSDNLKEVDGYQIRLITTGELKLNLGWLDLKGTAGYGEAGSNANVPTWVYRNYGESIDRVNGYWTMSEYPYDSSQVSIINTGYLGTTGVHYAVHGVRPVINLLKSSI